jgi:glycosyltransferase involved in cell wall biosynthesis
MPTIHKGIIRFAAQKRSRLRLLAGAVYDTQRCRFGNEGLCGWLCANSAAEDFARAITLARTADLLKMGQNARRRAEGFRWSVEAARFLEFIEGPGNNALGDI